MPPPFPQPAPPMVAPGGEAPDEESATPTRGPVYMPFSQPQIGNPQQPAPQVGPPQGPLMLPQGGGAGTPPTGGAFPGAPLGVAVPGMTVPAPPQPGQPAPGTPPQPQPQPRR